MSEIRFDNLGPAEYERAKSVLNKAKHPGFVGRELFFRCATSGICCIAVIDGVDSGVAMITRDKLQALSVIATAQGRGVGPALMTRLMPRWVSAIEARVGFFEKLGYVRFGAPKVGQNGKHATQLMERGESAIAQSAQIVEAKPPPEPAAKRAVERLPAAGFERLAIETDPLAIKQGLLRTLDSLYDQCVNRVRLNRAGDEYADMDSAGATKAVELAARILGAVGQDPAVLIEFRAQTEKLVKTATTRLVEREAKALRGGSE